MGGVAKGLVHFLHATGVIVTLKRRDLVCGGGSSWLFCDDFIVINT